MTSPEFDNGHEKSSRDIPWAKLLLAAGALLLIGWLGLKSWRLVQLAQSLQAYVPQAETLAEGGLMNADPDQTEDLVMNLRKDVVALDRELRPLVPIATRLGWLPRVGPLLSHSEALLDMADSGTEASAYAVRGLKPALVILQSDSSGESLIQQLMPVIQNGEADLLAASTALDRAIVARALVESLDGFPWRVRSILEMIDNKLYLADELRLLTVVPAIMGADGPKTYLIMAQNEDEIRATGGFLTGAGLLAVDGGEILGLSFEDGNLVDDWSSRPYDFPPQPLYDLMGLELFLYRDANFWPHFPASAEQAMQLYSYGRDGSPQLDGAIAIDQQFVAMLLAVTGPVHVPQIDATVDNINVVSSLRDAWGPGDEEEHREWVRERKDFLGPLAQALRTRLLGDFGSLDPLFLAETMHRAAQEKHLQIYVRDARVASVLEEIGWDGRQEVPDSGDYLMVVDTNVGYNKVNPLVTSAIEYNVVLMDDGTGTANLNITYEHHGESNTAACEQVVPYAEGITYNLLMDQCFWNYLRIYVRDGITPVRLADHPLDGQMVPVTSYWDESSGARIISEGQGNEVISNRFVLARGERLTSQYEYRLPVVVDDGEPSLYRLEIHKQAGVGTQPLTVRVTVPPGATMVEATPHADYTDRQVVFETELFSNAVFEVHFR